MADDIDELLREVEEKYLPPQRTPGSEQEKEVEHGTNAGNPKFSGITHTNSDIV